MTDTTDRESVERMTDEIQRSVESLRIGDQDVSEMLLALLAAKEKSEAERDALREKLDVLADRAWSHIEAFPVLEDSQQITAQRDLEAVLATLDQPKGTDDDG